MTERNSQAEVREPKWRRRLFWLIASIVVGFVLISVPLVDPAHELKTHFAWSTCFALLANACATVGASALSMNFGAGSGRTYRRFDSCQAHGAIRRMEDRSCRPLITGAGGGSFAAKEVHPVPHTQ